MSHVFTPSLAKLNTSVLQGDVRAILVMSNTDADTNVDAEFVGDLTLDEYDGASYARVALTSEAFAADLADNRAEWTADQFVFTSLGAGTRQCVGLILYLHVTNDADSPVIAFYNGAGFPFDGNGQNVTFNVNAAGLLNVANAA